MHTYRTQECLGRERVRSAFLYEFNGMRYNLLILPKTATGKTEKGTPSPYFKLRTLRPERMSILDQQVIDLSRKLNPIVPTGTKGPVMQCQYEWDRGAKNFTPFPENTRGVFYYHNAPDKPELCAGVRFRICDSAGEFEDGLDLLDSSGNVWGYKLLEVVKHASRKQFFSLLRTENLIDEELINDINKLDISLNVRRSHYSLFEPFHLDVAQSKSRMTYVTRAKVILLIFPDCAFSYLKNRFRVNPLTGQRVLYPNPRLSR